MSSPSIDLPDWTRGQAQLPGDTTLYQANNQSWTGQVLSPIFDVSQYQSIELAITTASAGSDNYAVQSIWWLENGATVSTQGIFTWFSNTALDHSASLSYILPRRATQCRGEWTMVSGTATSSFLLRASLTPPPTYPLTVRGVAPDQGPNYAGSFTATAGSTTYIWVGPANGICRAWFNMPAAGTAFWDQFVSTVVPRTTTTASVSGPTIGYGHVDSVLSGTGNRLGFTNSSGSSQLITWSIETIPR